MNIRLLLIVACFAFVSFLLVLFVNDSFLDIDVAAWSGDWEKLQECIDSSLVPCHIGHFPVAYLINSFLLKQISQYGVSVAEGMTLINSLFLLLPIVFVYSVRGIISSLPFVTIYCLSLLLSPLPAFYVASGTLEVQSGVVIGLFLSTIIIMHREKPSKKYLLNIYLGLTAFLFPMYKDTNLVMVILAVVSALVVSSIVNRNNHNTSISTINLGDFVIGFIGLGASLVVIFGYNAFKYGSLLPAQYMSIASQTSPDLLKTMEFLVASIFSPNGGLLIFWSASFAFMITALITSGNRLSHFAILLSIILLAGSCVGLSFWWVPFGWDSWGNRLIIPSALASLITIIFTSGSNASSETTNRAFSGHIPFFRAVYLVPIFLIVVLSFRYTVISYYSGGHALHESLYGGKACIRMRTTMKTTMKTYGLNFWRTNHYYECARERFLHFP